MILNNLTSAGGTRNIVIEADLISSVSEDIITAEDHVSITFNDAIVFPGLVNSHDHLDFNLFPQLGEKKYNSYVEWAEHIHLNYKKEINEVLKVPQQLRAEWGLYKNLLCGVTTVINHGKNLDIIDPFITVVQPAQNLHSVKFEKLWKVKLNNPLMRNTPVIIHTGEGIDKNAGKEIDELVKWNLLKREMVAIHGVAMTPKQAAYFKALVWCPDSNYFLLNKTAGINRLKQCTHICFGTDSTLTGSWNIWTHIKLAKKTGMVTNMELYKMLTKSWSIKEKLIEKGSTADIVVAKQKSGNLFFESFYTVDPEDILLILHKGNIKLADESILPQLQTGKFKTGDFCKLKINGANKYVFGNVKGLMNKIQSYFPSRDAFHKILGNDKIS